MVPTVSESGWKKEEFSDSRAKATDTSLDFLPCGGNDCIDDTDADKETSGGFVVVWTPTIWEKTIIFLHACYSSPQDARKFKALWNLGEDVRLVAPAAPLRDNYLQWFRYTSEASQHYGVQDDADRNELKEQRLRLLGILQVELQRLPDHGSLLVVGISQGASMALDVLCHLTSPCPKLRAVVSVRGMIQDETLEDIVLSDYQIPNFVNRVPVLAVHGKLDQQIPYFIAQQNYGKLGITISNVNYIYHDGPCVIENRVVSQFIKASLG
eukprot:TRINITY_DN13544_c0_g1_i1.p1 TRINITY_DN13544_c0_g1~~TRINITY_DN13544_c0_g1_i1.p1  ORF type:complete len:268 (+),score=36.74 TRINITY_DN13544_c0_g1_i1:106-909(+)